MEATYLMERDDGMLVSVPASKLGEWDPSDTKITDGDRQMAAQIVRDMYRRHGKALKTSVFPGEHRIK